MIDDKDLRLPSKTTPKQARVYCRIIPLAEAALFPSFFKPA